MPDALSTTELGDDRWSFHTNTAKGSSYREKVEFEITKGPKGLQAANVRKA